MRRGAACLGVPPAHLSLFGSCKVNMDYRCKKGGNKNVAKRYIPLFLFAKSSYSAFLFCATFYKQLCAKTLRFGANNPLVGYSSSVHGLRFSPIKVCIDYVRDSVSVPCIRRQIMFLLARLLIVSPLCRLAFALVS